MKMGYKYAAFLLILAPNLCFAAASWVWGDTKQSENSAESSPIWGPPDTPNVNPKNQGPGDVGDDRVEAARHIKHGYPSLHIPLICSGIIHHPGCGGNFPAIIPGFPQPTGPIYTPRPTSPSFTTGSGGGGGSTSATGSSTSTASTSATGATAASSTSTSATLSTTTFRYNNIYGSQATTASTSVTSTTQGSGGGSNGNYVIGGISPSVTVSNCTCVPTSRCPNPDSVHTFGTGLINPRKSCGPDEVCCTHPNTPGGQPTTTASSATGATATASSGTGGTSQTPSLLYGCGVSGGYGGTAFARVISSETALYGEFPWVAALLERTDAGLTFVCGGTVVSYKVILTAAHCVDNKRPENLLVRLGEWDASTTSEPFGTQEIGVAEILTHPSYHPSTLFNDLAILFLSQTADINRPNIGISCLPAPGDLYHLNKCVVVGWGKTSFDGGSFSAVLKKREVPIVDQGQCQSSLQETKLGKQFRLHPSFLCAGKSGADACTGDGGGPLLCPLAEQPRRLIQVGVVSWGIGCGGTAPGVYTDLTQLAPWVTENLHKI